MPMSESFEAMERLVIELDHVMRTDLPVTVDPDGGRRAYEAAVQLAAWVGDDPERWDEVSVATREPLHEWLLQLPYELADAGLVDEAVQIGRAFAELVQPETMLGDRAEILATSGRVDEARAQAEENLARFPGSVWTQVKAGYVFDECGDGARAEALYRRGYELAGDEPYGGLMAAEQLAALLEAQGRAEEARPFREACDRFREVIEELENPPGPAAGPFEPIEGEAEEPGSAAGPEGLALRDVARKVLAFGARPEYGALHGRALRAWFGNAFDGMDLEEALGNLDDEAVAAAFLEWMLFDLAPEGRTVADLFAARRTGGLDEVGRTVLDRLRASCLSLYEVRAVGEGTLALEDLLRGGTRTVRAVEESEWIVPGDLFAARRIALDGADELTGSVLPYDPQRRDEVLAALQGVLATNGADADAALKQAGPLFGRLATGSE